MDTSVTLPSPYEVDPGAPPVDQEDAGMSPPPAPLIGLMAATTRSIPQAVSWARRQVTAPAHSWFQLCLSFVRQAYGLPAVYPSAKAAWDNAQDKVRTTRAAGIPRGVPVFYRGGKFWHVVLSLGDGLCLSNDVRRRGRIDVVRLDAITEAWGYPIVGWTRDLNGRTLPAPPRPAVRRPNVEAALAAIERAGRAKGQAPGVIKRLDEAARALNAIPRKK